MKPNQKPTVEIQDGHLADAIIRHPAFAQVTITRATGNANLYGSDFDHQYFIIMTVWRSELNRGLSYDRPMSREKLIEVAFSEAQWATFVSSISSGSGVQATLQWLPDEGHVPQIARESNERRDQFAGEMQQKLADATKTLDSLMEKAKAGQHIGKRELLSALSGVRGNITNGTSWVTKQFDEHMEETVEKARSEIEALSTGILIAKGLEAIALGNAAALPLQLSAAPEEESEEGETE